MIFAQTSFVAPAPDILALLKTGKNPKCFAFLFPLDTSKFIFF